jgi:hypothetical protein
MRAWIILVAPMAAAVALCCARLAPSQPVAVLVRPAAAVNLPVTQLVLYSNGLGHFKREGEVDGRARIELVAQTGEMNDMLKSIVIDDNAATPAVVYDSPDSIEQSLPISAVNIIGNPALGDLLHQSRGEAVEISVAGGTGEIAGAILGMEERIDTAASRPDTTMDVLNLWTDAGVRGVLLKDVRSVRFVNAKLDAEVRRALAQLVTHRDSSRKILRVNFNGQDRRRVGISYVAEAPVWKASYRLTAGPDGTTRLQGWALVENTTTEDWNDVKLTLAGSRPVSFQMDLYPPLFVPRPIIEPAQFAALRPPTYGGPMQSNLGFGGGMQGQFGGAFGFAGGTVQNNLGFGGGGAGFTGGSYRSNASGVGGGIGGSLGGSGGGATNAKAREEDQPLTFDKYKRRLHERKGHSETNEEPIHAAMEIAEDPVGEPARYVVPGTVSIPSMKSALVPFFSEPVVATSVSVFSPAVHLSRALQAFRVKNNTGHPLSAGPVTVARADGYAGDARFTDWPADEERFVAFAVDLGCECRRVDHAYPPEITAVKLERGRIEEKRQRRMKTEYGFRHRGGPDRTVWIEHPIGSQWKLIKPAKADERTRDGLRFKVELTKGNTTKLDVELELAEATTTNLANISDTNLRELAGLPVTAPAIKQTINETLGLRDRIAQTNDRLAELRLAYKEADDEQARLRKNLERIPDRDAVQRQLLEKLAKQEAIIDENRRLSTVAQADLKTLKAALQSKTAMPSIE